MSTWGSGPVQVRLTIGQTTIPQADIRSFSHRAACCDGDIGIGQVCAASISAELTGARDLLGQTITAELGESAGGVTTWHELGTFVVSECQRGEDSTHITAQDAAWYATAGAYVPTVSLPLISVVSVRLVLADVADQCGLSVEQATLNAISISLLMSSKLSGHTCREMLGYLAALCGRNCVISRGGKIRFVWFEASGESIGPDETYAGTHTHGGTSTLLGLKCTIPNGDTETTIAAGNAQKAVEVVCPYMTQTRLDALWDALGGYQWPVLEVSCYGGAELQPGDVVTVTDRAGNDLSLPVMEVSLSVDGGCRCTLRSFGKGDTGRAADSVGPREQRLQAVELTAGTALQSANGKNKCFYQASAPAASVGLTAGDIWFDTANGNRLSTWTGTAWSVFTLRNEAVSNLDAGSITTGKLAAARVDIADIFAQNITATGSISGATLSTGDNFSVSRNGTMFAEGASINGSALNYTTMQQARIEDVLVFPAFALTNPYYDPPETAEPADPEDPNEAEEEEVSPAEAGYEVNAYAYTLYTEQQAFIIALQDDEDTVVPMEGEEEEAEPSPPTPTKIAAFSAANNAPALTLYGHLSASGNAAITGDISAGTARVGGGSSLKGIWAGTKVVQGDGTNRVTLFTAAQALSAFGYTPASGTTVALLCNGHYEARHTNGISGAISQSGDIYAECAQAVPSGGSIRINYTIIRFA